MTENYPIRPLENGETAVLEDLLYEAVFQQDGEAPLPREIIYEPGIYNYIRQFRHGHGHDYCLAAEGAEGIAGAVWVRVLDGEVKGYGNIGPGVPEFAIALFPEHRNRGVGSLLMAEMIAYLREKGYEKASLSVQKENPACRFYRRLGFDILQEQAEDYIMVLNL